MRTFVIRARKAHFKATVGKKEHVEIIAHTLANAFYISNQLRNDVEVYVVLDSAADFPKTIKFSSNDGLSFPGFHEEAILGVVANALERGQHVALGDVKWVAPGIEVHGYGFDTLLKALQESRAVYLLDNKGDDIRTQQFESQGIFVLSDHIALPKKSVKGLERRGLKKISLGKKVLFASQCVVLVHNELDRQWG